jgi:hypothetical protein
MKTKSRFLTRAARAFGMTGVFSKGFILCDSVSLRFCVSATMCLCDFVSLWVGFALTRPDYDIC